MTELDILSTYAFADQELKYFESMPGILDYLTYIEEVENDDGSKSFIRKRLKPVYKDIYRVLKKLAGEGACMKTTAYIAKMCGCSPTSVVNGKIALSQAFEQLDGNPLISITQKYTMTKNEDVNINKKPVHITTIQSIGKYNNPFMKLIYNLNHNDTKREPPAMEQEISLKEAELSIERMSQPGIQETVHNLGGDSKNGTSLEADSKNGTSSLGGSFQKWNVYKYPSSKQIPLVKKQNPTERSVQLSLINQKNVEDWFCSEHKASEFLEVLGFKRKVISDLLMRYNLHEMLSSVLYLKHMIDNGKEIPSITGYFLSILKNKWWIPKCA